MKRAYLSPPITASRALDRVRAALCADPRCGDDFPEEEADVVILQVVGRYDQVHRKVRQIKRRGQRYAVIQYVLRSSKNKYAGEWMNMWNGATAVWSYLDLWGLYIKYEGGWQGGAVPMASESLHYWKPPAICPFNLYHAPLGVDGDVFQYRDHRLNEWQILSLSTGRGWLTESAREVTLAARAVVDAYDQRFPYYLVGPWHLGSDIGHDTVPTGEINDNLLAWVYQNTNYVSGLRRTEGFELPAAEGLLCGARPILFDQEHYRRWYGSSGIYLHEGDRECVLNQLIGLFKQPVQPVTQAERDEAARRFHWPTLVDGFLTRCLA